MQIKHFLLIAASIALPAIAAPLPNHDSSKLITPANHRVADVLTTAPAEIVIVDDMPPVVSDNGDAAAHKRSPLDPIEEKWKCADDEDEELYGLFRNTLGVNPDCVENDWNGVEDWKPSGQSQGPGLSD